MKKYYCPVCIHPIAWILGKPQEGVVCSKCGTEIPLEELIEMWEES